MTRILGQELMPSAAAGENPPWRCSARSALAASGRQASPLIPGPVEHGAMMPASDAPSTVTFDGSPNACRFEVEPSEEVVPLAAPVGPRRPSAPDQRKRQSGPRWRHLWRKHRHHSRVAEKLWGNLSEPDAPGRYRLRCGQMKKDRGMPVCRAISRRVPRSVDSALL